MIKAFLHNNILLTGLAGLLAAILVGTGEFLLHYSAKGYGNQNPYKFMLNLSRQRLTLGHFIAVSSTPLYLAGYWHIYKMLKPAGGNLPAIVGLIGVYGMTMGSIWIGSRSLIASIVQLQAKGGGENELALSTLVTDYKLYSESLLQVIRVTIVLVSLGFIYLVYGGDTNYPRWMMVLNPFFLLAAVFLTYKIVPAIGKYIVPIAMNVSYGIFFIVSLTIAFQGGVS